MCTYIKELSESDQPLTAIQVRDAIIKCFGEAHDKVLDSLEEFSDSKDPAQLEKFKQMDILMTVKSICKKCSVNFDNPTKEDLVKIIDELAKFSSNFRSEEIINRNYEIALDLINRIA